MKRGRRKVKGGGVGKRKGWWRRKSVDERKGETEEGKGK